MKKVQDRKQIRYAVLFMTVLLFICVIVYKAQIEDQLEEAVSGTLMSEHRDNDTFVLSAEQPELTEQFICNVPKLRKLKIQYEGEKLSKDTVLVILLTDAQTGKEYYYKEKKVSELVKKGINKQLSVKLPKKMEDTEGKEFLLTWRLVNPKKTRISLTMNKKPGLVTKFNGSTQEHGNVIYQIQYADCTSLSTLYLILCILVIGFAMLAYILVYVKKWRVERFYIPLALYMGVIMQGVIAVYGVPDEPWHMDTAYQYSNRMLFVKDSGENGMLWKRKCDVEMADMLANDVETNSYYQLLHHTWERAEDKELVLVAYVDSGNLVPGLVFVPTAVGITIGRLLGLSAMLTFQLGRLCNLLVFVLLSGWAVRRIPYGKHVLAMIGMLPIALQQAASASYDAVINGIMFLFVAECLLAEQKKRLEKRDWVILGITGILTGMVKGGVYIPVLGLLYFVYRGKHRGKNRIPAKWIAVAGLAVVAGIAALIVRFLPVFRSLLASKGDEPDTLYSASQVLSSPLHTVCLYWNTVMKVGDKHLRGVLGGMLSWHDIEVNWLFLLVLAACLILAAHIQGDYRICTGKRRSALFAMTVVSVSLIMMSMLLACTTLDSDYILGLQGRYYLPLVPLVLTGIMNPMIRVKKHVSLWLTMAATECLIALQVVAVVMQKK